MAYPGRAGLVPQAALRGAAAAGADGRLSSSAAGRCRCSPTIATLGTPQDITLQEVRIECFFPADDRSDALFKSLAAKS